MTKEATAAGWLIMKVKKKEGILVGDFIEFIVSDILGSTVKIALKSPRDIKIRRTGIDQKSKKENNT